MSSPSRFCGWGDSLTRWVDRYPDAVANVTHSAEWLGAEVVKNTQATRGWLREDIYGLGLGIHDVTEAEVNELWPHRTNAYRTTRILADAVSVSLPMLQEW